MSQPRPSAASEFERLAFENSAREKDEAKSKMDNIAKSGKLFWFMVTLLLGVLFRLIGFVDYDFEKIGFPEVSTHAHKSAVRSTVRGMYLLVTGFSPIVVLKVVISIDTGGMLFSIIVDMMSEFVKGGVKMDGVDISELLELVRNHKDLEIKSVVPDLDRDTIGLSSVSGHISGVDPDDEELLANAVAQSAKLSSADCVAQFSAKFVSCKCQSDRYFEKHFPYGGRPIGETTDWHEKELSGVVEALKPLARVLLGQEECHICNEKYIVSPALTVASSMLTSFGTLSLTDGAKNVVMDETGGIPSYTISISNNYYNLRLGLEFPLSFTRDQYRYAGVMQKSGRHGNSFDKGLANFNRTLNRKPCVGSSSKSDIRIGILFDNQGFP